MSKWEKWVDRRSTFEAYMFGLFLGCVTGFSIAMGFCR